MKTIIDDVTVLLANNRNLSNDGDSAKCLNPFFSDTITFLGISQSDFEAFVNKFGNPL